MKILLSTFKKFGHYDDSLQAKSLDELMSGLSDITEQNEKGVRVIRGTLADGTHRNIYISDNKVHSVHETGDGWYVWSHFDKNSGLCGIHASEKSFHEGGCFDFSSKDGIVDKFSLCGKDGWICHEGMYDATNPIKI